MRKIDRRREDAIPRGEECGATDEGPCESWLRHVTLSQRLMRCNRWALEYGKAVLVNGNYSEELQHAENKRVAKNVSKAFVNEAYTVQAHSKSGAI